MEDTSIRVDADRLSALMTLRGLDDQGLADRMDMSYNGVKRIQREQSTSLAGLDKLSRALDCSPYDLLVVEGYNEPLGGGK